SDEYDLSLDFTRYLGGLGPDQHVYFAAHAKLRQINTRLNRKAGVRQNTALVVDFKVIHVCAIGVNFGADGVACSVNEIVAESCIFDVRAHSPVNFPARNRATLGDGVLNSFHAQVTRLADG